MDEFKRPWRTFDSYWKKSKITDSNGRPVIKHWLEPKLAELIVSAVNEQFMREQEKVDDQQPHSV
jgi:hypothetical protein